jgi:hypothetical protein
LGKSLSLMVHNLIFPVFHGHDSWLGVHPHAVMIGHGSWQWDTPELNGGFNGKTTKIIYKWVICRRHLWFLQTMWQCEYIMVYWMLVM